ncbi:hypothetical protein [Cupriavidus pauculus]|uniref:Uncharacterized protein n=1 Tax=Cupriavidus pauculus TaxID=82633 RepID=A0A2N5C415_9BURK|nr:hypothetical protein [Cupriavidus pauculus]PLP96920.1 hypothetical protein CYJ10_29190 [Cupriavidus pauculus]
MTLAAIRDWVANDGLAITFQSMGQYRTALLRAIDQASASSLLAGDRLTDEPTVSEVMRECEAFEAAMVDAGYSRPDLGRHPGMYRYQRDQDRFTGWKLAHAILSDPRQPGSALEDSLRLDALQRESWNLRCFDHGSAFGDGDVGWRVIEHHMGKPYERTVAEVFEDDPRAAIDAACALVTARAGIAPGWQPITAPGQVTVGDKLRFTIGDKPYSETVKEVLHPGTDKEELIYNMRRNYYLITSMSIKNTGSQRNVLFEKRGS